MGVATYTSRILPTRITLSWTAPHGMAWSLIGFTYYPFYAPTSITFICDSNQPTHWRAYLLNLSILACSQT